MEIEVRTFHLGRTSWANEVIESYLRKIKPFEKIQFKVIKDTKKWFHGLEPSDRIWICDERGKGEAQWLSRKAFRALEMGGARNWFLF